MKKPEAQGFTEHKDLLPYFFFLHTRWVSPQLRKKITLGIIMLSNYTKKNPKQVFNLGFRV
jgi:hypothetical protein